MLLEAVFAGLLAGLLALAGDALQLLLKRLYGLLELSVRDGACGGQAEGGQAYYQGPAWWSLRTSNCSATIVGATVKSGDFAETSIKRSNS
jgi:hypothetical protein